MPMGAESAIFRVIYLLAIETSTTGKQSIFLALNYIKKNCTVPGKNFDLRHV